MSFFYIFVYYKLTFMDFIKVKVIKKNSLVDSSNFSDIKEGDTFEGFIANFPKVGEYIYLYKAHRHSYETVLRTTQIQKIESNLFFTKNSIYEIISVVEERDKLISAILDN